MAVFTSKSRSPPSPIISSIRKRPFLYFGLPFLSLVVISSFALQEFTQTRYDYHGQKTQTLSQEEALGMNKERKKVDIREEYYRLNSIPTSSSSSSLSSPSSSSSSSSSSLTSSPSLADSRLDASLSSESSATPKPPRTKPKLSLKPVAQDEYEPVRVPRPAGMPEWGPPVVTPGDMPIKGHRKEDRWV